MDAFIVTLALPTMARQFGVGIHHIKWVLVAYLTAVTVSLMLAGRLADLWGRKRVTVIGVVLLMLGSALCALAPTLAALIAFRVLQGVGGALVLACVMAEITATFPPQERRRAMGINASVLALGQITGLVLGGLLIESLGWRSIFVVILIIAGIGLALDLAVLRDDPARSRPPLDTRGGALSVLIVGIPFLLIERFWRDLRDPAGVAFAVGGLILLGLFVRIERRSPWPILDLRLLRSRAFICGAVAAAFYFVVQTFGYFLLPLYAQIALGLSPFGAGLLIVPLSVALTVTSQLVGRRAGRLSARLVSTAGLVCTSVAVLGMSTLDASLSYPFMVGLLILAGIGGGLFQPPNNCSVLGAVPSRDLGGANGFFTMARNFGQAIGAALAAAILARELGHINVSALVHSSHATRSWLDTYVEAQSAAFRVGAVLGLLGAIVSLLRGGDTPSAPPGREPDPEKAGH